MGLIEAIILGIVQGLTEFLPVSSSGHLEIAKTVLNEAAAAARNLCDTHASQKWKHEHETEQTAYGEEDLRHGRGRP